MTTAFYLVRLIETLSHPSMSKRGSALASYLDLVTTLAAQFSNFCSLSFKVWLRPSQTLQQYITWGSIKAWQIFEAECVLINGLTRHKAPIPEEIFFELLSVFLDQERVSSIVSPRDLRSPLFWFPWPRYVLGWKPQHMFAASDGSQWS